MWPFKKKPETTPRKMTGALTQCGTPPIWANKSNPTFFIPCTYRQADGSTIIEDEYPYNGRREARVVPKGDSID
jgi:hypothetical protein